MKPKPLPLKTFNKIFNYVPRIAVDLFIERGNEVLLAKRTAVPKIDFWHLPGSFIWRGERIEQTAKRCAKTELGVKIKLGRLRYVADSPKRDPRGHVVSLVYSAKIVSGNMAGRKAKFFRKLPKKLGFDYGKILRGFGYR